METSESINELAEALAKAQAGITGALKDSANPFFKSKYADLASVMEACLPALNSNGICVIQPTVDEDGTRYVKTILAHTSGQTLECRVPLIVQKNDMQGYGSAVTYARRYGLMGMAGIAPEDDDGNAAAKAAPKGDDVVERRRAPATEAIDQAWRDGVLDSLPEDASPRDKAEAFAEAIAKDFASVSGVKALNNRWDRHAKMIGAFQANHPDLHEAVVDAFETRRNEITPDQEAAE